MTTLSAKKNYITATPVLFSFFVMSFCDLAGIGVDNAKADFQLNNTLAQLIPSAIFVWFFLLSVPVGIWQDRIGKRNMVNIGMVVTAVGLLLPFFYYSFAMLIGGFVLLGIGNTIIQVSANPLLIDVTPLKRQSSFLSFAQFVKAIGSMVAPWLASWFAIRYGDWKLVFLTFGVFSMLATLWLHLTPVAESQPSGKRATFGSAFSLLGIPFILLMVVGIFFIVGIDVGINAASGQFLMEHGGLDAEPAKQARSLYFFGKMVGTFGGALLLTRLNPGRFLLGSGIATLLTILAFIWIPTPWASLTLMFLTGMAAANVFPLIFSLTVSRFQHRANEISGLMIMAVSGGAFIPLLIGKIADISNIRTGMMVLTGCAVYLIFIAMKAMKHNSDPKTAADE